MLSNSWYADTEPTHDTPKPPQTLQFVKHPKACPSHKRDEWAQQDSNLQPRDYELGQYPFLTRITVSRMMPIVLFQTLLPLPTLPLKSSKLPIFSIQADTVLTHDLRNRPPYPSGVIITREWAQGGPFRLLSCEYLPRH
jgi:hypothetical protein